MNKIDMLFIITIVFMIVTVIAGIVTSNNAPAFNKEDCVNSINCEQNCLNFYSYGISIDQEILKEEYRPECRYKCLTYKHCIEEE